MRTAVCYYSRHHGNTRKVLEAMAREGEIDLVVSRGPYLCFVEVKLRRNAEMAEAREFVTPGKQRRVRTAALYYLMEHPSPLQPRFDVVEVYAPQGESTRKPVVRHWEGVF